MNESSQWVAGWLASEETSQDVIVVKRIYIDINDGNLHDGLIFSQIMYWHGRNKETGKTRLSIKHEGELWLAKSYEDWYPECRIIAATARKCIDRIAERGLITKKLFKFDGAPVVHVRVNWDELEKRIKSICYPVSNPIDTPYQNDSIPDSKSSTEHTTEHTTEPIVTRNSANSKKGKVYSKWQRQDVLDYYALHTTELDMLVDAWGYMTRYKDMTIAEAVVFAKSYEQLKAENFNPAHYQGLVVTAKSKEGWKHDFSPLCLTKYITEYLEKRLSNITPLETEKPAIDLSGWYTPESAYAKGEQS